MTQPHAEIERRVSEKYQPTRNRMWEEYQGKQTQLFFRLGNGGKVDGSVASLMEWAFKLIEELILLRAHAYIEVFNELRLPVNFAAEQSFSKFSRDCAQVCREQMHTRFRLLPPKVAARIADPGARFDQEVQQLKAATQTEGLRLLRKQRLEITQAQVNAHVDNTAVSNAVPARCFPSPRDCPGASSEAEADDNLDFDQDVQRAMDASAAEGTRRIREQLGLSASASGNRAVVDYRKNGAEVSRTPVTGREKAGGGDVRPTVLGRNINRLRLECGWSLDELSDESTIDKKGIMAHINLGRVPHPSTLKKYARAFSRGMGRQVSVAELQLDSGK